MYFVNFLLLITLFLTISPYGNCIKCYSCNSRQERQCLDPFTPNFTRTNLDVIDCSDEVSTRQFILYFSNLMSALGVSVNMNANYNLNDGNQPSACQKVEINGPNNERIIIRNCAILSEIACDTLKRDNSDSPVSACEVCDSDYCNSGTKLFSFWNLLPFIIQIIRVIA